MAMIAADQLLAEHAPALRNFLGARCRDADLTADLLQEVAARLVAAAPRLSLNGNARGYLFRIAANGWRDYLRRGAVRRPPAGGPAAREPRPAPGRRPGVRRGGRRARARSRRAGRRTAAAAPRGEQVDRGRACGSGGARWCGNDETGSGTGPSGALDANDDMVGDGRIRGRWQGDGG